MNSSVAITRCKDYDPARLQEALRKSIDLIGGITNFIKPQSKVLVKPNLLMAKAPESGIVTHPEVTRAVIKILKEINCKIFVGDSPSVLGKYIENVAGVYEVTGTKRICQEEGVELVDFTRRRWRKKILLTSWLDDCEHLVSIPKFKTHNLTLLTGAIKNLFGLVSGTFKTELHKNYFERESFSKVLVDIYAEAKPSLTIVDAIVSMEGDGPATSGTLRNTGLLLCGSDCVALDSLLALIMGINPFDVLTTKEAALRGMGVSNVNSMTILGEKLQDVIGKPFLLPTATFKGNSNLAPLIKLLAKKLIKYYPCAERDNCISCAACIQACPNKAISMRNKRIVFDYSKCIACFCCQETCPAAAIKLKKGLFTKLFGL